MSIDRRFGVAKVLTGACSEKAFAEKDKSAIRSDPPNDLRVVSVPVDFEYPASQTGHETGNRNFQLKRLQQYGSILVELGDPFWTTHEYVNGVVKPKDTTQPSQ